MPDLGCERDASTVHRYDKAEVATTPNEFARKAPTRRASMTDLADQPINDAAISTNGEGGQTGEGPLRADRRKRHR